MEIILASSSSHRKALLDRLGLSYKVVFPDYEEDIKPHLSHKDQVGEFARGKTLSVINKIAQRKDLLVMGFDSLVEVEGKAIGKPKTKKEAFEIIQSYRGKKQSVATGMCLAGYKKGKYFEKTVVEESFIYYASDTTNCQIRDYLDLGEWKGRAGGFSVQGPALFLMERMEGDFHNIVGIPLIRLGKVFKELTGKNILKILKNKEKEK